MVRRKALGWFGVVVAVASPSLACSARPAATPGVATPSLTIDPHRVALGSPLEMTVKFTVASDVPAISKNYRVFVHFLDADGEKLWGDDHDLPPTVPATSQWKPGAFIEYTRTSFIPVYPYIGNATIAVGLYTPDTNDRLPLVGTDNGQRAYTVATLELLPQSENVFLMFKDGWQPAEVAEHDPSIEWQWSKREATIVFANPKADALFYLQYDGRPEVFPEAQHATLSIGGEVIDSFQVDSPNPTMRKIKITAAQFGTDDKVELKLDAGGSFVPAQVPNSNTRDTRELGIRVYHAYIRPL